MILLLVSLIEKEKKEPYRISFRVVAIRHAKKGKKVQKNLYYKKIS